MSTVATPAAEQELQELYARSKVLTSAAAAALVLDAEPAGLPEEADRLLADSIDAGAVCPASPRSSPPVSTRRATSGGCWRAMRPSRISTVSVRPTAACAARCGGSSLANTSRAAPPGTDRSDRSSDG